MNNEDFQKTIIDKLDGFQKELRQFGKCQDKMYNELSTKQDKMYNELSTKQDKMYEALSTRQDEMYQVLRSIEHSNNAGKAELDSHNVRVSKIECKMKKVAKAWQEDVEVSNL